MNHVKLDRVRKREKRHEALHLFGVDEHTLVFAFLYALGRQTAAPSIIVTQLKAHWSRLKDWTRQQIHQDITHAIEHGAAGSACDVATWREVLALPGPYIPVWSVLQPGGTDTSHGDDDDGCPSRADHADGDNSHS